MLQHDFFVPGSVSRQEHERYRGKELFREVLTVTGETTMLYFGRVIQDILSSESQRSFQIVRESALGSLKGLFAFICSPPAR